MNLKNTQPHIDIDESVSYLELDLEQTVITGLCIASYADAL